MNNVDEWKRPTCGYVMVFENTKEKPRTHQIIYTFLQWRCGQSIITVAKAYV